MIMNKIKGSFDASGIPASWVVVRKATGEAVLETYCRSIAEKINQKVYSVIPVLEYLYSINETLKKG